MARPDTREQDQAPEVSEPEKALVAKYDERIKAARSANESRFRQYEANRKYYRGTMHRDGSTGLTRTNIIFSTIASIYPQIYAKDPDISLAPAESTDEAEYDQVKLFGRTAEVVLDRMLVRGAKLKKRIKSLIRSAMICEVGWLKCTYQTDVRIDPVIKNRMDDIQDNIQRLKAAKDALEGDEGGDPDLKIAELQAQIEALRPGLEQVVSQGIVLDKLATEDVLILDPTVRDHDDYVNASAICQQIWMTEDRFEALFGRKPNSKAQKWYGKTLPRNKDETNASRGDAEDCFVCVREIWAKEANTVYTHCEGEEGWCRPPYQPTRVGKRWYPFFALCFNPVDGEFYGISDVQLLIELQEEYSRTRTALAEHRRYAIPIRVVRAGGGLTPEDVENLTKAKYGDTVVIGGDSATPLRNDVDILQAAPIDPAVYDVTTIRADIEMVTGASDAVQGSVLQAKTATEAEIMRQGLAGRTIERQDTIEDMIEELAEYSLQLCIRELTVPEVIKMAGAKAVWPSEPTEDALNTLRLEIRAGSTGKPDMNRERDQWIQLMPIIQEAMARIMELRQAGQNDMADAVVELTRESLRRFDERIDIDSFLPRRKEGESDPQAMMQQAQAQAQALAQENQALKSSVEQLMAKLSDLQSKVDNKQAELEQQAALEREKLASSERIAIQQANTKAVEGALAEAIAQTRQIMARLDALEKSVGNIPAPAETVDKNEIMLEVRDLLDKIRPVEEKSAQPIQITVPVTVVKENSATRKTGKAIVQPDGSIIMQSFEEPAEAEPAEAEPEEESGVEEKGGMND